MCMNRKIIGENKALQRTWLNRSAEILNLCNSGMNRVFSLNLFSRLSFMICYNGVVIREGNALGKRIRAN